jgi:hypothetical protein
MREKMAKKIPDHFEVEGHEVRFLQDAPVTVCVIRSLTDRSQKYTGISVCHPSDVWDEAVGRHKALKDVLNNSKSNVIRSAPFSVKDSVWMVTMSVEGEINLPMKEIQHAYWEHYKNVESKKKNNAWDKLSKQVLDENRGAWEELGKEGK